MTIITRFAPSPTGLLHPGHAYAARIAQELGETLILRIEDIDPTRCKPEFTEAMIEDLTWLRIKWQVPIRIQSEDIDFHIHALNKLKAMGLIYPCFCTRSDITAAASAPHGPEGPVYGGTCKHLSEAEVADKLATGLPFAQRLHMDKATRIAGPLTWEDRDAGQQQATPEAFGDIVLARKETPTSYHLAVTVDDARQGVDLVTRGEDLFTATHVQRLLQALLDLPEPDYYHHPLVIDPTTGRRFAKRDKSITLQALREGGKTPQDIWKMVGLN